MLIKFQFAMSIEGTLHFNRGNSYKVGTYPNCGWNKLQRIYKLTALVGCLNVEAQWYAGADQLLTKSIEPENIWFLFLNVLDPDPMKYW